ncbi:MAG: metallophosphoesterase [Pseudomonadales bacterium]|nr:metallophosphoesterase [Pseudomonadales bacterium]
MEVVISNPAKRETVQRKDGQVQQAQEKYDLIGDIHGEISTLRVLLDTLGYRESQGRYQHPGRRVVFLGDFVDRGAGQREVVELARDMVTKGDALAVMGNHEFNAIAYYTPRDKKNTAAGYLREHSSGNQRQHRAFLEAYQHSPKDYADVIDWFKTLPMWLDLPGLRAVHACWDPVAIARLEENYAGTPCLNDALLRAASDKETWEFDAVENLLKGKEVPLPKGLKFTDAGGKVRHRMRIKWWSDATTYASAFMGPEEAETDIPDDEIEGDHLVEYSHTQKPVFLGHYWLKGEPSPLAPNIACLDYSVAKPGGKLVAYRWDGEGILSKDKFVAVDRQA